MRAMFLYIIYNSAIVAMSVNRLICSFQYLHLSFQTWICRSPCQWVCGRLGNMACQTSSSYPWQPHQMASSYSEPEHHPPSKHLCTYRSVREVCHLLQATILQEKHYYGGKEGEITIEKDWENNEEENKQHLKLDIVVWLNVTTTTTKNFVKKNLENSHLFIVK